MQNQYNVWCKWHPLKTVMLGTTYLPEFYNGIKNNKIQSALKRISEETHEDLDYFQKILKDFGCEVLRPDIDKSLKITDLMQRHKISGILRAPLQPRDAQLVAGSNLVITGNDNPAIQKKLLEYNDHNLVYMKNDDIITDSKFLTIQTIYELYKKIPIEKDFPTARELATFTVSEKIYEKYKKKIDYIRQIAGKKQIRNMLGAPCITTVGKDLYVDLPVIDKNILKNVPYIEENFRINLLDIGGHNDGCFHTVKEGAILSLFDIQNYQITFPNWDVCYLENQSWSKVEGFLKMKDKVRGSWWVPGEEDNNEFTEFVQTWLNDWVGYVEESVFDVNVLVLDEKHVCVNNMNPIVVNFLKKHGMEAIHVPWRHRYFWDGGLHCITLDLYREGVQEDYFPDRKGPVSDDL